MGKNKVQPYQLFVRDEFNKMKRAGEEVVFNSLYQALDSKWQSLPQERKLWYKERASNGGHINGAPKPANPPPTSQPEPSRPESKLSSSNFSFSDDDVRVDNTMNSEQGIKIDVDVKPVIKEERGIKRELEVDNNVKQDEQDNGQLRKKKNLGFGIPNWRNIRNSSQPDADRYFDHHLVKLREQCESIVATQHRKLLSLPLHTFSCNVLCKYKKDGTEVKYIPIEIGINTYSIKNGHLKPPYHVIIDSGPPPSNRWGDTLDHLTSTHKINVTHKGVYPPEARKDYKTIYKEMVKYVKDGERTILVADNYDLEQVKKSIEWLYEMAALEYEEGSGPPKPTTWTILPLVDFVAAAYNFVYVHMLHYPLPKFTLNYYLKVRLETSIWDYDVDLMCPYHKKGDNQTKWCARSCAIRVINALQMTFEEIFKNYKTAEEAKLKIKQANDESRQDSHSSSSKTDEIRTHAQQLQQPLHMPEEKEPPPVFEEMARREEIRRRQEEALRNPPPPPGDYNYDSPLPSQDNCQPKAIKPAPHKLNMLDPRIRRSTNT